MKVHISVIIPAHNEEIWKKTGQEIYYASKQLFD